MTSQIKTVDAVIDIRHEVAVLGGPKQIVLHLGDRNPTLSVGSVKLVLTIEEAAALLADLSTVLSRAK